MRDKFNGTARPRMAGPARRRAASARTADFRRIASMSACCKSGRSRAGTCLIDLDRISREVNGNSLEISSLMEANSGRSS